MKTFTINSDILERIIYDSIGAVAYEMNIVVDGTIVEKIINNVSSVVEDINQQYYIDTLGNEHKYLGCVTDEIISMHFEIAKSIYPNIDYPDDKLMELGWIKIGCSAHHTPMIDIEPTQAQINKMDKLNLLKFLEIKTNGVYKKWQNE